ncbi:unnamed protein product [Gulo gulo]|uniref:Uncharacterized protein n=1 Tax=Gulo gulo TaxID=48420 RepID=A0A9X9PY73_GULGU|nr:unnamed protein product [Gulo gulo]
MLLQTFNLFRAGISLDGWEESHVENFLTELHQQLEYLGALRGPGAEQNSGVLSGGNPRLQVKKYFWRIHDYLENQEYSSCAWTIVRVEIIQCLFFAFPLVRKLSKQETDSLKVEQEPSPGFKSIG